MKKLFTLIVALAMTSAAAFAQEGEAQTPVDGWTKGGGININLSQSAFSNWAAGGDNAVSFNGLVNGFANYQSGKHLWTNNLNLAYGLNWVQNEDLRKTDDLIQLLSKYGYEIAPKWYGSVAATFRTQFTDGYEFPEGADRNLISGFAAPAYVTLGLGVDWVPNDVFGLYLSPLTARWTFVTIEELTNRPDGDGVYSGAFGVDSGETMRFELGAALRAVVQKNINENLYVGTSLNLFTDYLENPGRVDVIWNGIVTAKVWKYISVSLTLDLIYDYDILINEYTTVNGVEEISGSKRGVQFKEVLGIGFAYSFGDKLPE